MKPILLGLLVSVVLVGTATLLFAQSNTINTETTTNNNVVTENGQQIISISAKGGYAPQLTVAQADLPTIIKVTTNGTFDCSSSLTIPSLNYHTTLPPTGETTIEIPPQAAGSKLQGLCSMGMYNFTITFN